MPRMKAVSTVTWSEWDDRTKRMEHKTLHPADPGRGRQAEAADVPDEVVARVEQIREREIADHLAGRVIDPRAGHVRWVPEDEYDEYVSEAGVSEGPVHQFTDDEIRSWDADTTIAHMNQAPDLAGRVLGLEEDRKPRRRAVVAHAQRIVDAQDGKDVSQSDEQPDRLLPAEES